MASTALPHERGHGIRKCAPVALRFHRRVAATSNSTPAGSRSSAKIRVNRCAQGVLIATPSRVAKLHRHQVGFDLRELLIDMARYLQRREHLVFTNAFGRKPAEVAALLAGKLYGRDRVAVSRSALAVSAPSVPAPIAERICVPKPGRPRRRL